MSDEDPIVNGHPLSSLRVVDLREELEKRGLPKTGNKKELADRLREFLTEGTQHEASPAKSIPEAASPTKSPENSLVAAYKARQAAALNKATVEKERVRRASESVSPQKDSPSKPVQKDEESDSEADPGKEETRKEEIEEKVDKVQLEVEAKTAEKKIENEEKTPAETKPETPPPKAVSSAKESPPHKDSKEDTPTTKSHKERSRTPSPETPEEEPKKASQNGAPMTAVEAEQEDHVELDYGDGDMDETNVEDEPKKSDSKELETPSPAAEAAVEEKPKSQERQKIKAPPREKSVEHKKGTSSEKGRDVSPSRYPESEIVHIRGLMRPFTIPNLKLEICKQGGEIADFWIDNLRSHCFVKMGSVEQAAAIRNVLHNHHWPASNPKKLTVQFDNQETMDRHKSGESPALVSASNSRTLSTDSHHEKTDSGDRKVEKTDRRDRPTLAPLGGRNGLRVTLETMVRDNSKKEEEDRERREKDGREKAREIEKKMKEREVKEKEERENRKRHRSVTPPHRADREKQRERRSPDRKERRRNESSRGDQEEKKTEEAPVKKTADEFFKKTVAQPSIYYLPLTEDEAVARAAKRERERR